MTTHVIAVAPADLDDVWPHIKHYIGEGLKVAGDDPQKVAADILAKEAHLWVVVDDHPTRFRAAFLTAARNIDGKSIVVVYGLAGKGAHHWAKAIEARMVEYTRALGASSFRFAGKDGWGRLLPECKPVDRMHGVTIYERAA